MIFQCNDLERALRSPELMPDARAHAETCESCRQQLYLWTEISRLAPQLHQEWESPQLWSRIRADLVAVAPRAKDRTGLAMGHGGCGGSRPGDCAIAGASLEKQAARAGRTS